MVQLDEESGDEQLSPPPRKKYMTRSAVALAQHFCVQDPEDSISEDDLAGFLPSEDSDVKTDTAGEDAEPAIPDSVRLFPSQSLLSGDHYGSLVDYQDVETAIRGVTPTQFGQMVCCIRHGLTKHSIRDLVTLIKSNFFERNEVIEYDQIKTRHKQLLPLLPLYCREMKVLVKYQKKTTDQGRVAKQATFLFHYLSVLDVLVREVELLLTGSPLRAHWSNHAVVQPVACALAHGKTFRSSPEFTFAYVTVGGTRFKLGDDILAVTDEGQEQLCKLVSIFIHCDRPGEDGQGEQDEEISFAVYVQPYTHLANIRTRTDAVAQAQARAVSNEVVLETEEVLLKGLALEWIKRTITVLEEPMAATSPHTYVCRYVHDGQVCPLSR